MYQVSVHNIPSISSFQKAEAHWNKEKPWRGQESSWRPLDSRHMQHKRIVKNNDGGYECTLHQTIMVTYYPNRVTLGFHGSRSSKAFANRVAPRGCELVNADATFWSINTKDGVQYFTKAKQTLSLNLVSDGVWELENEADEVTEWTYNPKQGAHVRKLLGRYATWYRTIERMGMKISCSQALYSQQSVALRALEKDPTNSEIFPDIARVIGSPEKAMPVAYRVFEAYTKEVVPSYRLPRKKVI